MVNLVRTLGVRGKFVRVPSSPVIRTSADDLVDAARKTAEQVAVDAQTAMSGAEEQYGNLQTAAGRVVEGVACLIKRKTAEREMTRVRQSSSLTEQPTSEK